MRGLPLPLPAAKTTPLACKILCVSRRVLWKSLSIRLRVFYNVLDVLPNLFLEVLVEFLLPKQSQFGLTWLPNQSTFHETLVQPRSWAVPGATLETRSKIIKKYLTSGGLLGTKLAGLGAQDGVSDGQVGGTFGPKWSQHVQNNRSEILCIC